MIGPLGADDTDAGVFVVVEGGMEQRRRVRDGMCALCFQEHLEKDLSNRMLNQYRELGWIWVGDSDLDVKEQINRQEGGRPFVGDGGWWKKVLPQHSKVQRQDESRERVAEEEGGEKPEAVTEVTQDEGEGNSGGVAGEESKGRADLSFLRKHVYDENMEQCCEICFSPYAELDDAHGRPLPPHLRNELVFCSKCDILVHQGCYGGSIQDRVPEGDWTCQACLEGLTQVTCVLCPVTWGPVKPTDDGRWAHVACMHFVPETEAGDGWTQEPVINIKDVPEKRFDMDCIVCGSRAGACVQCQHMTSDHRKKKAKSSSKGKGCCNRPFHVGCAVYMGETERERRRMMTRNVCVIVPFPLSCCANTQLAAHANMKKQTQTKPMSRADSSCKRASSRTRFALLPSLLPPLPSSRVCTRGLLCVVEQSHGSPQDQRYPDAQTLIPDSLQRDSFRARTRSKLRSFCSPSPLFHATDVSVFTKALLPRSSSFCLSAG